MRPFLIVLALLALFATGWHAAFQGSDIAHMRGAPQIERTIHRGALHIVANAGGEPVEIRTSGRYVTMTGPVESIGKRDTLLRRIAALPLVIGVIDETTVLDRADPFTLEIVKASDGSIRLEGSVPNHRAEDRLLAEARGIGDGARVTAAIRLASGVPDGNWTGMVLDGLRALAVLSHGSLRVSGTEILLTGEVADPADAAAVEKISADAPMGRWSLAITAAAPKDGYRFTATMPARGAVAIGGHAPDAAVRDRLVAAARTGTGRAVSGAPTITAGMPGPAWPDHVAKGLTALAGLESGTLDIRDWQVRIAGNVDTDEDRAALTPLLDEGWEISITVRNPTPPSRITVVLDDDGTIRIGGLLPAGLSPEDVRRYLPDADLAGVDRDARGKRVDWSGLLEGLSIVLPRFARLEVVVTDRTLGAKGMLKPDFSADGVRAALRIALDRTWTLSILATERRPQAEITLTLLDGGVSISGVLPVGIGPEDALALAGVNASGIGLAGGGEGDLDAWQAALRAVTELLVLFEQANGRILDGRIELTGLLSPGYGATAVRDRLDETVPATWTVLLSATETPASEGDRRRDLVTGRNQSFRNGFWLPEVSFPVSADRCASEIDRVMADRPFAFATESASIPPAAEPLLNGLAAVAIRCLNSSDMKMEISAHTSSVGNDAENRLLTERRANAVAAALARRGVRPGAIVAVGRGEEQPIATNDTPEGRARNQRIAFRWLDAD